MSTSRLPSSDLTQQELQRGYWLVTHKPLLCVSLLIALSSLAAISVGALVWTSAQWLLHRSSTQKIEQSLLNSPVLFANRIAPQALQNIRSTAIRRDDSHVDALVQLSNPNTTWGALNHVVEVIVGGQSAGSATVSLAPGQTWYITRMNVPWTDPILPRVELVVHDAAWRRMPDIAAVIADTWEYTDTSFGYVDAVTTDAVFQSELSLTVRNTSIVGFREPEVVVTLQDDTGVSVAVGSIVFSQIGSLESRSIRLLWPQRYPRSLTPVIHMNVDKMNEDRIIRPTVDVSS